MDLAKGGAKLSINKTDFKNYKILRVSRSSQAKVGEKIRKNQKQIDIHKKEIWQLEKEIHEEIQKLNNV